MGLQITSVRDLVLQIVNETVLFPLPYLKVQGKCVSDVYEPKKGFVFSVLDEGLLSAKETVVPKLCFKLRIEQTFNLRYLYIKT